MQSTVWVGAIVETLHSHTGILSEIDSTESQAVSVNRLERRWTHERHTEPLYETTPKLGPRYHMLLKSPSRLLRQIKRPTTLIYLFVRLAIIEAKDIHDTVS